MAMNEQGPLWDDSRIDEAINAVAYATMPDMRRKALTPFSAEQLLGSMRREYEAKLAEMQARIDQLHKAVGTYAINATSDGWRITTLENELTLIREKLKDQPPVYDHLDRWLYGEQEQADE